MINRVIPNQTVIAMADNISVSVCEVATEELSRLICQAYRDGEQGILAWSDTDTRLSNDTPLEDIVSKKEIITAVNADNEIVGCVRLQAYEDSLTGNKRKLYQL